MGLIIWEKPDELKANPDAFIYKYPHLVDHLELDQEVIKDLIESTAVGSSRDIIGVNSTGFFGMLNANFFFRIICTILNPFHWRIATIFENGAMNYLSMRIRYNAGRISKQESFNAFRWNIRPVQAGVRILSRPLRSRRKAARFFFSPFSVRIVFRQGFFALVTIARIHDKFWKFEFQDSFFSFHYNSYCSLTFILF